MTSHNSSDNEPIITSLRRTIGFFFILLGMFAAFFDTYVTLSIFPQISASLGASIEEGSRVQSSYLIAEVLMIGLSGYLVKRMSLAFVFSVSSILFSVTSYLCALATSIDQLTVCRFIQGLAGGAMIPTAFSAIYILYNADKHALVGAIAGAIGTLAPTLAPSFGAYAAEVYDWRIIFYINIFPLIIGGFVVYLAFKSETNKNRPKSEETFDYQSFLFLIAFVFLIHYVIDNGLEKGWLESRGIFISIIFLFFLCVSYLNFFSRINNPLIEWRVFKSQYFMFGTVVSFFFNLIHITTSFVISSYFADIAGMGSEYIGKVLLIVGVFQILCSPIAPYLASKIGYETTLITGLVVLFLSIAIDINITDEWTINDFFFSQALRGCVFMIIAVSAQNLAMSMLPRDLISDGSTVMNMFRALSAGIGIAAITSSLLYWKDKYYSDTTIFLDSQKTNNAYQFINNSIIRSENHITPIEIERYIAYRVEIDSSVLAYSNTFFGLAALTFLLCLFSALFLIFVKTKSLKSGKVLI